ncbi:MAG: cytochrome c biogenesis protein CcsA [Opitutaceae bacterium]|nr:cytochrome c biogenesis protein CcsA [Opitutaceae bacterium]
MFEHLTDRNWLWLAGEFYLVGFLLGTWSLWRGGRPSGLVMYGLVTGGYMLQLLGLYLRGRAVGGCPLGNTFELFQFTAWSATSLYLLIGVKVRSSLLGYFTACLSAALTLVSLAIPAWDATRRTNLFGGNPWIEFHAALALFSYGVFALLTLTAVMLLLRNHSLKHKRLGGWFSFLPSIIDLDLISVRLLGTGVTLLAASLAVGSVYWLQDLSRIGLPHLFTIIIWAAYAITLLLRLKGWLISRLFAWAGITLFAAAMLSLPVNSNPHAKPPVEARR